MKKNIINIFQENKYFLEENSNKEIFFLGKKGEYFLISEYNKDDIKEFFESIKTDNIINFVDKQKNNFNDIGKNTSLIILLKVDDLIKNFEDLKNYIMRIEEDEYFFRKYVIVYDEKGKNDLDNILKNGLEQLQKEVKNINLKSFREYKKGDTELEYKTYSKDYLLLQLFIKLPFLQINWGDEEKDKLKEEIGELLGNIKKKIKSKKLDNIDDFILNKKYLEKIENINREGKENNLLFNDLENKIFDLDNDKVDDYLEKLLKL